MYILHYWPGYCSLATHIVLRWLGAEYSLNKVDYDTRQSKDYQQKINPSSTVPALALPDGNMLSQNIAILNYLADLYPEAKLCGDGTPLGRARVNRWLGYINSDVHKAFSPLLHPERIPGDAAAQEATKQIARTALRRHFEILNAQLTANEWIAGEQRSVADPYLFVLVRWAKVTQLDLAGLDHLLEHYARVAQDPAVTEAMSAERLKHV
ncbi:glutathione S-transferase family protein [Bradyrhizobium tropiciagri]|uniref:glutathione binding-like protein n=1 Tax=Bradyrhizobium tropiciagri TaxID=312253 RepID=UPI001BA8AA73|nr:glutathione binding-like protein [Bradyrhizobium tropiciagri]MBR0898848.1 glutathione S-transferase family protein [Bradyrhizobium tropiciagri]